MLKINARYAYQLDLTHGRNRQYLYIFFIAVLIWTFCGLTPTKNKAIFEFFAAN